MFRIKYLQILNEYEKDIKKRINININNLKSEKNILQKEKNRKKYLLEEKNKEFINLENDKNLKKNYLKNIKSQKKSLENELKTKKANMAKIEGIIKELFKDKEKIKQREQELAEIRAKQNKSTSGNFAKMKGKLPWPTTGNIVEKFGMQNNNELNTVYENIGIDIETVTNAPVYSVLDGVVTAITYIRDYGNVVIIDHGAKYYTVYSNINNITVSENEYISSNHKIANVSKNSMDKNILHFEIWENQKKLNPQIWLTKK